VATIGWVTSTLVDTSEDWVDQALRRQWPGVLENFNPLLPSNIAEDDLSAIPTLVEVGQQFADSLDWQTILSSAAGTAQSAAH